MPLVKFSDLDFKQIKTQIKEYLRSNSTFTDFDFEGSNFSILIDVLAYNTYISSYNANMLANEVFIDSATLRENVVSLARNIGYLPSSKKAAKATVSFLVDTSSLTSTKPTNITLRAGLVAVSDSFGGSNYTFSIPEDITVSVIDNIAFFTDIEIYEGTYLENTFTVNTSQENQRFIIPNSNVDTSTLNIKIKELDFALTSVKYNLIDKIIDVNEDSKIYLLNEVADERYEIIFGDGVFGRRLENGNVITASYIITNGSLANGITNFTFTGRLVDNADRVVTNGVSAITVTQPSVGGGNIESIDSVRKYAPKKYAAQNRAVTAADYDVITKLVFEETESTVVFGGESLNPPQYGRVFIGIKPKNGRYLSNFIKKDIENKLRNYSVAGIVPMIIDLNYLYVEINSSVYYDTNKAVGGSSIKTMVINSLDLYKDSAELNKFGARLKYSKLLSVIDETSSAITSNITKVVMRRDLRPNLNTFADYEICFGNKFHVNSNGYNIKTSGFFIDGYVGEVFLTDIPSSDGKTGTINIIRKISPTQGVIIRANAGTVDYVRGEVNLNPIRITSTSVSVGENSVIEISVVPDSNDVIGLQDLFLQLDISKSIVNAVPDNIASGNDMSGSNYTVSSSFTNGLITR